MYSKVKNFSLFTIFTFILTSFLFASIPNGYYDNANNLSGEALKTSLYNIIKGHNEYSYTGVWTQLKYTDEDPNNSNNVILLYTGWSISKNSDGGGVSDWNREHVWAKSHGDFGTSAGPGTDLHHLRPTDVTVNSRRGNLDFDNGGTYYVDGDGATYCKVDGDSWEPRDEVKGDVARMIFYMATRYEGQNGEPDLEINEQVDNGTAPYMGKLSTLLEWHNNDPVDAWEIRRNDRIYDRQHNRNPFIDHPEYANYIWGGETPDDNGGNNGGDDGGNTGGGELANLIISEVAGNPAGSYQNEFVEIYNASDSSINLNGYQVILHRSGSTDITAIIGTSGTSYGSTTIPAGGCYVISRGTVDCANRISYSGFYLNKNLYVTLKNSSGEVVDEAGNASGLFNAGDNYELTDFTADNTNISNWLSKGSSYAGTPGTVEGGDNGNTTPENSAPYFTAYNPSELAITINTGETIDFSVSATDADNDNLSYSWKLNGTTSSNTSSYSKNFTAAGTFTVSIEVNDVNNHSISKNWQVTVNENIPSGWTDVDYVVDSPHDYPNNYDNTWTISKPGASKMKIYFSAMETESKYDFLYIYDKNNSLIAKYDGNKGAFWTDEIAGDEVKVTLKSDYSVAKYGFQIAKYSYLTGTATGGSTASWISEDYALASANPYANNYDNTWTITKDGAEKIKVHFSNLDTETNYDFLYIYDAAGNEIEKITGNKGAYWTAEVTGNTIKIRLTSDYSVTKTGFVVDQISYFSSISAKKGLIEKTLGEFALNQNHPNPFNPTTSIGFFLPTATNISLKVFNIKGELVKTVCEGRFDSGSHSVVWNGKDNNMMQVASGIYFYRLQTSDNKVNLTQKMILIK